VSSLLRVDLGSGESRTDALGEAERRRDAGGGLLGTRLLLEEVPAGLPALHPSQLLVFASGIVAGQRTIALPRFSVVAKSPLSRGIGEARVEGPFGPALRDTGHDALVLAGRAEVPSCVVVRDGVARVEATPELWGLDTGEVTDALLARFGPEAHVAAIGPAGERGVRFASVVCDRGFAAARMGLGAAMGAKRLKAVVVVGGRERPVADPEGLEALRAAYAAAIPANALTRTEHDPPGFGAWPGPGREGYLGVENYTTARAGDWSAFTPEAYLERLLESSGACPGCPQDCMKRFRSGGADPRAGFLHQEAVAAFAANLGIRDLDRVLELNASCQLWGVDPVALSFALSFACETGRAGASFGDAEGLSALAADVAHARGAGAWLADGVATAGDGHPAALHSKGIEIGSFDPRGSHGQALAYAMSPLGPRYDVVEHDVDFDPEWGDPSFIARAVELGGRPAGVPMASLDDDKVRFVARALELWSAYDALGVCLYAAPPTRNLTPDDVRALVRAVTGWEVGREEMRAWGRRRLALMRAYNLREGIGPEADDLPDRFFTEPVDAGRLAGARLDRERFARAKALLARELGWDPVG